MEASNINNFLHNKSDERSGSHGGNERSNCLCAIHDVPRCTDKRFPRDRGWLPEGRAERGEENP